MRAGALLVVVVAVASALTVGTVLHLHSLPKPAGSLGGPAGTATTPTVSALPTQGNGPLVAAVDGFLPQDVTAVSADQWWVLGFDTAGCSGAACDRILATADGGQTFTSIPTPSAAVSGLRFGIPRTDGPTARRRSGRPTTPARGWSAATFPGLFIEDLETSGGYVYAIACTSTTGGSSVCSLKRSPDRERRLADPPDPRRPPPLRPGPCRRPEPLQPGGPRHSDVPQRAWERPLDGGERRGRRQPGAEVHRQWGGPQRGADLRRRRRDQQPLRRERQRRLGRLLQPEVQEPWLSVNGGATFSALPAGAEPTSSLAGIAAASASDAVVAGGTLQLTADGGRTFRTLYDNGSDWSIVGFTTSEDGFALSSSGTQRVTDPLGRLGPPMSMWRTVDGGAAWYQLQFPEPRRPRRDPPSRSIRRGQVPGRRDLGVADLEHPDGALLHPRGGADGHAAIRQLEEDAAHHVPVAAGHHRSAGEQGGERLWPAGPLLEPSHGLGPQPATGRQRREGLDAAHVPAREQAIDRVSVEEGGELLRLRAPGLGERALAIPGPSQSFRSPASPMADEPARVPRGCGLRRGERSRCPWGSDPARSCPVPLLPAQEPRPGGAPGLPARLGALPLDAEEDAGREGGVPAGELTQPIEALPPEQTLAFLERFKAVVAGRADASPLAAEVEAHLSNRTLATERDLVVHMAGC